MIASWIAVDWGTSNLRVWAMGPNNEALDQNASDAGMATLAPDQFEPALLALLSPWLSGKTRVLVAGMAGAKQGWQEAPYQFVPCEINGLGKSSVDAKTVDPNLQVKILSGLAQKIPADVMRGEETQIAGLCATRPNLDAVICLPGTHTKWARVNRGEILAFKSYMTGELFSLLSQSSVLRHSIGEGWDDAAFENAITEVTMHPSTLSGSLFSIRARSLLGEQAGNVAKARLSGLLIGTEITDVRHKWPNLPFYVAGNGQLAKAYQTGLEMAGQSARLLDVQDLTLAGLIAAYKETAWPET